MWPQLRVRILVAVSVVILFEITSLLFWELYGASRVPYHEGVDLETLYLALDETAWRRYEDVILDRDLGWLSNPDNPLFDQTGSRRAPEMPTRRRISAYGDSFVFGTGVQADKTFPFQLATLLGNTVLNRGVGGYGPDQAILRLERDLISGERPEVVILGMPSENIARIVNVLRKLYIPTEAAVLVKPVYYLEGGEWRLINAVPAGPPTKESGRRLLAAVEKYDRWFAQNKKRPKFRFPYSLATVRALAYFSSGIVRWQDLYEEDVAVETLRFILTRFVALSKDHGFQPVFVIIPMPEDLLAVQSGNVAFYSQFLEEIAVEFGSELFVVDVLAQSIDLDRFHLKPFSGHASAYGNSIVAQAIFERLDQ